MAEEISIFGQFAVLIAQILTLITIGTIIIQCGRWLTRRRMPRDYYFFFLIIVTVVMMQLIAIWNFNIQNQQLLLIEQKQSALQNITLSNQQQIIDIHKKQLAATLLDAQIRNITQDNGHLLQGIHKKISAATIVNNSDGSQKELRLSGH